MVDERHRDVGLEVVLEDHSREQVPADETRGYVGLTLVFLGVSIAIPSFLLGSALTVGMGLQKATEVIIWGSLISTPMCLAAAHVGSRSRLSTALALKLAFGQQGAKVISAIIAIDMFCWFAVNTEIFGTSMQYATTQVFSAVLSKPMLSVLAGVFMTAVTIFGYRSVEKLAVISVPLLVALLFAYVTHALLNTNLRDLIAKPAFGAPISYATGISIVAGTFLSICVLLPDFTRYSRSSRHAAVAVLLGFTLGLPPFVLMGAFLTAATGESDFVKVMLQQGWAFAAVVVIALTTWVHMNATLYSASLNLAAIVKSVPRWKLTVAAGIAGTTVALIGIISKYVPFLVILSVVLPPIAGVYTADFFLRGQLYLRGRIDAARQLEPTALFACLAGVVVGFMTAQRTEVGFGLFNLTYLPAIDSFLVSFVTHYLLLKLPFACTARMEVAPASESRSS